MVLRCTRKLFDLLGNQAPALSEAAPSDEDWYGNLLWIDRRKCLLLTHAGTLFSIFRPDVRKAELSPIGPYVVAAVQLELRREELPFDAFGVLNPNEFVLGKTASRSVLGFMNDMAFHLRYQIADAGGIEYCDGNVLNHRLRRTLHNRGGYVYPLDLVAGRLGQRI